MAVASDAGDVAAQLLEPDLGLVVGMAVGRAMRRMKRGPDTDRKDFFSYFLSARDPETGTGALSDEEEDA